MRRRSGGSPARSRLIIAQTLIDLFEDLDIRIRRPPRPAGPFSARSGASSTARILAVNDVLEAARA